MFLEKTENKKKEQSPSCVGGKYFIEVTMNERGREPWSSGYVKRLTFRRS